MKSEPWGLVSTPPGRISSIPVRTMRRSWIATAWCGAEACTAATRAAAAAARDPALRDPGGAPRGLVSRTIAPSFNCNAREITFAPAYAPSILRRSAIVAALLGIGQPPWRS